MKRDIALDPHFKGILKENELFDFATPYGYGGWLIEGSDSLGLFDEYEKWCVRNNIVSEFVRFHPVLKNHRFSEGYYEITPLGQTVAIDTTEKERIWQNFNTKNRNVIRKAVNSGIKIFKGNSKELFDAFKIIYEKTMDKDNANPYYYFGNDFYESIRTELADNSRIFYAALNDKIVSAAIIIFANGRLNYHLSGSIREYQNLAPSNLLLWKVAEWGNDIGCKTFHLGGGVGSQEDSLFRFKRAFYRGDLLRYCVGRKVFIMSAYERLLRLRGNFDNLSFFPRYRGI